MLIDTIKADMKDAMRAKDTVRLDTLRGVIAACTNELVTRSQKPTDPVDDALVLTVLKRLLKQRKDAVEQYTRGGRPELAQKESTEATYIQAYLPAQASREEIVRVVNEVKASLNATDHDTGKLIGAVMKALGGSADGALVRDVIDSLR